MSVVSTSLHDVRGDAHVRIRAILFELVREACAARGVHPGQSVRVRRSGDAVLVELPAGRTVPLSREWARFIEVEPHASARPAPALRVPRRRRARRRP
jgi:hypothetical protein